MDINILLNQPFTFTRRNQLIPSDLRPVWKASLVVIIFGLLCKNNKCSLKKLHLANWISKSADHVSEFLHWANDNTGVRPEIRMEPALDRVIELMAGDKLLVKSGGSLEITELGIEICNRLTELSVFEVEIKRLRSVKKFMAEANVERAFKVV